MTTKINGYPSPVQIGTEKSVQRARDAGAGAADAASGAQSTPVQITDKARQLAALESALQNMPVVDEARVAEVRTAIEEGRYQANPESIAEKLIQMESDLAGHSY